ncbi:ribonuclease P protein component [Legionella waltersii]|uniref:ribonuclease P protein component n=1 Tax=Legionella waltersii TaxID=66969 RepID=UPI001E46FE6F|nr:ribonuclease P protein component [Legionella waltersii]
MKKKEYDEVFKRSQKISTNLFIVLYKENNLSYPRLGLALSKKMISKAHDRNRVKRLIRESFRMAKLPPMDLVVLAKPGLAVQNNLGINVKLNTTWEKITSCYSK